jgi:hypothetical protein
MLSEPLLVVARLARAFEDLAIRYLVGGSLASSLYGIPRATQDVDLVAEIELAHVEACHQPLFFTSRWGVSGLRKRGNS